MQVACKCGRHGGGTQAVDLRDEPPSGHLDMRSGRCMTMREKARYMHCCHWHDAASLMPHAHLFYWKGLVVGELTDMASAVTWPIGTHTAALSASLTTPALHCRQYLAFCTERQVASRNFKHWQCHSCP
jgi:hypothetical protein